MATGGSWSFDPKDCEKKQVGVDRDGEPIEMLVPTKEARERARAEAYAKLAKAATPAKKPAASSKRSKAEE